VLARYLCGERNRYCLSGTIDCPFIPMRSAYAYYRPLNEMALLPSTGLSTLADAGGVPGTYLACSSQSDVKRIVSAYL
jgi:hypothetical protein